MLLKFLAGNPTRIKSKESLGVDGRKILDWSYRNRSQFDELDWFASEYGLSESPCECGIQLPGSISHVNSVLTSNS